MQRVTKSETCTASRDGQVCGRQLFSIDEKIDGVCTPCGAARAIRSFKRAVRRLERLLSVLQDM